MVQPSDVVVAVYVVVLVGLTLRVVPEAPVFQVTLPAAVAVSVTGVFAQTVD